MNFMLLIRFMPILFILAILFIILLYLLKFFFIVLLAAFFISYMLFSIKHFFKLFLMHSAQKKETATDTETKRKGRVFDHDKL